MNLEEFTHLTCPALGVALPAPVVMGHLPCDPFEVVSPGQRDPIFTDDFWEREPEAGFCIPPPLPRGHYSSSELSLVVMHVSVFKIHVYPSPSPGLFS